MSKRTYMDLKDILCNELDDVTRKGNINRESLDDIYKLTSTITMIESLLNKKSNSYDSSNDEDDYSNGYSMARNRIMRTSYDNAYDDYSNARSRDSMTGRYASREYSRHTAEERIAHKLDEMIDTTQDPHIRETLMQARTNLK